MAKKIEVNVLWEAIKEPLRLLVLAVIPFVIAWLGGLPYEWAAGATVALRFIDKLLHELGKEKESKALIGGLTRF